MEDKVIVENFERIDKIRLIILASITLLISAFMLYSLPSILKEERSAVAIYIPIVLIAALMGFTFYAIYSYLRDKITLTEKALIFYKTGKDKRIELDQIDEISYYGVEYVGLIKALIYNVLFGRYSLVVKLKDGSEFHYPKVAKSIIPTGFRKQKVEKLIASVEELIKK